MAFSQLEGVMESHDANSTVYRGHNIVINPSGTSGNALTDAFLILKPTINPMLTSTLYERPRGEVKAYATAAEARDAAITQARAWIDARLDRGFR
jgi:hypothetical protein